MEILNKTLTFISQMLTRFVSDTPLSFLFWALVLLSLTLLVFNFVFGGDFKR